MSFKTCLSCIVTSYTELIDVSSGLPNLRIALFSLRISQYFSKKAKIQISHYHSFIGKSKHVMVRLWTIIKGRRWIFFIASICIMVEIVSLTRGGLMLVRYKDPGKTCKQVKINGSNITTSQVVHQPLEAEYIFHLIQYGVCLLLRCMEYVLLAQGFYKFTQSDHPVLPDIWSKIWKWGICWAIVLIPTLLLPCLATPAMAIISELSYASKLNECAEHNVIIYLTYAALTMFTYFFAYCVRVAMVFATIAVSRLWFPEGYYNTRKSEDSTRSPNTNTRSEQLSEEEQFIEDWSVVSKKNGELAVRYEQVGEKVECVTQIFQTWFMVPWIIFFIVASAETNNVLKPWSDGETVTTISALHYTIYGVNQVLSLLIPYLCGLKMNMFHSKFHEELRNEQMAEGQASSRRALARIMYIEKIEHFDFVSRVWGTNIKIRMSSPLYVVFLLMGIFFTICSSLYS